MNSSFHFSETKKLFSLFTYGGYIISAVIIILVCLSIDLTHTASNEMISVIPVFSVAFVLLSLFILKIKNRISTKRIIAVIFIGSFLVKLAYALKYPYTYNQHDIETIDSNGHLGYIYRLATLGSLPDSNDWQLYNPPLHYIFAAIVYKISTLFGLSADRAFENVQMLSVFWASAFSIVAYKILRELKLKGLPLILSYSVVAYHPFITILGGSINNDMLALLMNAIALLFLLRWRNSCLYIHALAFAIFSGMAVMTKYSSVFAVLAMLLYMLSRSVLDGKLTIKGMLIIALPILIIGFWYQARNALLFGQNIVYYNQMSQASPLYIPKSFIKRIIILPKIELESVFCSVYSDTNIILYLLKCSVFGEFIFDSEFIASALLVLNVILVLCSVIYAVITVLRKNKYCRRDEIMPILFVWAGELLFYFWYNFIEPFGCSMDFRIIPITLLCGTVSLGMLLKQVHIDSRNNRLCLALYTLLFVVASLFAVFSSLLFV